MKRIIISIVLSLIPALVAAQEATPQSLPTPIPTPVPRPAPFAVIEDERAALELYFQNIPQGGVGLLRVVGENVIGARALFLGERIEFFPTADDGLYGLLAPSMEQNPRTYDATVSLLYNDGSDSSITAPVTVITGPFIRQDVTVVPDRADLLDPVTERTELARLESIFSVFTPQRLWDESGFNLPLGSELTSPFGAFRTFNGSVPSRHTGWDMRAPTGTPATASAAGRVAFAGAMDIRGNHVVIDHGYGVFSTYSHLSQVHVTRGQNINAGQIIGLTGETGRSGGPHFHWEIAVNGEFVDSADFVAMWLPS